MKRRLVNILSAISLLLFVAVGVLWILNIWVSLIWACCGENGGPYVAVVPSSGCIEVAYQEILPKRNGRIFTGFAHMVPQGCFHFPWDCLGFWLYIPNLEIDNRPFVFITPDWFICSITAVLPFRWYLSYRRRRLAERKGLCPKCGYDLRASKDRCPECGTPVIVTEAKA